MLQLPLLLDCEDCETVVVLAALVSADHDCVGTSSELLMSFDVLTVELVFSAGVVMDVESDVVAVALCSALKAQAAVSAINIDELVMATQRRVRSAGLRRFLGAGLLLISAV